MSADHSTHNNQHPRLMLLLYIYLSTPTSVRYQWMKFSRLLGVTQSYQFPETLAIHKPNAQMIYRSTPVPLASLKDRI